MKKKETRKCLNFGWSNAYQKWTNVNTNVLLMIKHPIFIKASFQNILWINTTFL